MSVPLVFHKIAFYLCPSPFTFHNIATIVCYLILVIIQNFQNRNSRDFGFVHSCAFVIHNVAMRSINFYSQYFACIFQNSESSFPFPPFCLDACFSTPTVYADIVYAGSTISLLLLSLHVVLAHHLW